MSYTVRALITAARTVIREIDPAELLELQKFGCPIVDVREPEEFADGHLPGAVNIPRGLLEFEVDGHPAVNYQTAEALSHRQRPVVLYCLSGGRSALAAEALLRLGFVDPMSLADGANYHGEAYLRPLVKQHPETGVKNLFVARHAFGIPGLGREESRSLIKHLVEFAVSDEARVYRHQWTAGETILWDNRSLLHRAMPYDYANARVLIGTRVAGDPASELAYYPDDPRAQAGREVLAAELPLLRNETAGKRYHEAQPN